MQQKLLRIMNGDMLIGNTDLVTRSLIQHTDTLYMEMIVTFMVITRNLDFTMIGVSENTDTLRLNMVDILDHTGMDMITNILVTRITLNTKKTNAITMTTIIMIMATTIEIIMIMITMITRFMISILRSHIMGVVHITGVFIMAGFILGLATTGLATTVKADTDMDMMITDTDTVMIIIMTITIMIIMQIEFIILMIRMKFLIYCIWMKEFGIIMIIFHSHTPMIQIHIMIWVISEKAQGLAQMDCFLMGYLMALRDMVLMEIVLL